jgi:hypothetical protein
MLVVLTAWLAVVAVSLLLGKLPDAAVLGVPAAVVLALAPPGVLTRKRSPRRKPKDDEHGNGEESA